MKPELLDAIREFTGTIVNPFDLSDLLHRLTEHAMAVMDGSGAGIMLDYGEGLRFAAASADRIIVAEVLQERVEEGACYQAFATNSIVQVGDLAEDHGWPEYSARTTDLGLRAVVGVPMNALGQTIGVINIYRDEPTQWSGDDVAAAEILASMGAGYVVNANQLRAQQELNEHLQQAVESRDLIGQAKGMLMEREGVSADDAFDLLRSASQRSHRKLRDIAAALLGGQSPG